MRATAARSTGPPVRRSLRSELLGRSQFVRRQSLTKALSKRPSQLALSMDDDEDGHVSLSELTKGLRFIRIRAERFAARLEMERDLSNMVVKLPNFCVCVGCFLAAIYQFSPAAAVFRVHRHIEDHFEVARAKKVKDIAGLYTYMELFEQHNAELQATSAKYWCEERYAQHAWSFEHMAPERSCPSPRLSALGRGSSEAAGGLSWAPGNGTARRLAPAALPPQATLPRCEDDDRGLQAEDSSHAGATCASAAVDDHKVCDHDLGLLLCPKTCGYCSPFRYQQHQRFDKPQVTMLPTMVYQTRFAKAACTGFAATYEAQPHNPALVLLPALDGEREGSVLTCIDRFKALEEEYAMLLPCPAASPESHCPGGVTRVTHKHTFHGQVVYPELLMEPKRDISKMKKVQWVDLQTNVLTVSTMVYTEHLEIFTSVSVDFVIDDAGNVVATPNLISYRDLIGYTQQVFVVCLIVSCACACLGTIMSAVFMFKNPEECRWGYELYEFFSRAAILIYSVVLLVQWSHMAPMSQEYDRLLHTFLDMRDLSDASVDASIQTFFDVKTSIYEETSWLKAQRILAYVVCYVQFLQMIFYFNAHPKMAVLTATVVKALDQIFHFLLICPVLFLMLAFMAHWMVGEYIEEFGTFGQALTSQARMVFGEFLEAEKASELSGAMKTMYWIYACTFLLVVWMILLNFILAIVVDAFIDVKKENLDRAYINNFLVDLFHTFSTGFWSWKCRWPHRTEVIHWLYDSIQEQGGLDERKTIEEVEFADELEDPNCPKLWTIPVSALQRRFPTLEKDEDAAGYLHHFYLKCNTILLHQRPEAASRRPSDAAASASRKPSDCADCDLPPRELSSTMQIQIPPGLRFSQVGHVVSAMEADGTKL